MKKWKMNKIKLQRFCLFNRRNNKHELVFFFIFFRFWFLFRPSNIYTYIIIDKDPFDFFFEFSSWQNALTNSNNANRKFSVTWIKWYSHAHFSASNFTLALFIEENHFSIAFKTKKRKQTKQNKKCYVFKRTVGGE